MERITQPGMLGAAPKFVSVPPPAESLLNPGQESFWPAEVRHDARLEREATLRRELIADLDALEVASPDPTVEISAAVESGALRAEKAASLYRHLTAVLEDPSAERLALYVPLQFLPDAEWHPKSVGLATDAHRFGQVYMDRWFDLLRLEEPRAKFTDGDVPSVGESAAPVPMVVKAAHLVPALVGKGMLTGSFAVETALRNPGTPLAESLVDGFPLLFAMGALDGREFEEARRLSAARAERPAAEVRVSPARVAWLAREVATEQRRQAAGRLAARLADGSASAEVLRVASAASAEAAATAVEAVGVAAEKLAAENAARAAELVGAHEPLLGELARGSAEAADALVGVWSRLQKLGLVSGSSVGGHEVAIPKLDGSFEDQRPFVEADLAKLDAALRDVAEHPDLAGKVYPAMVAFGSRLKGYGTSASDLDLAAFVRPGVDPETQVGRILSRVLAARGLDAKPALYWLEGGGRWLRPRDVGEGEASSHWAHVLFAGAWQGESSAVAELHEKLLARYLHPEHSAERRRWLEELERDALLFRLAHRGYARLNPKRAGLPPSAPESLDPQATFWDPGYRRLATKLYAKRVFLPDLG